MNLENISRLFDPMVCETKRILIEHPGISRHIAANKAIGRFAAETKGIPTDPGTRKSLRDNIVSSLT